MWSMRSSMQNQRRRCSPAGEVGSSVERPAASVWKITVWLRLAMAL
jgi:hypothetical protein